MDDMTMPAVTVWQPWASLLAERMKLIETRRHDRLKGLVGEWVAIHAGKAYDPEADDMMTPTARRWVLEHRWELPRGRVVAVGKAVAHRYLMVADDAEEAAAFFRPAGLYGLFFAPVLKLPAAVQATGHQGIWRWTPPSDVREMIEKAEGKA